MSAKQHWMRQLQMQRYTGWAVSGVICTGRRVPQIEKEQEMRTVKQSAERARFAKWVGGRGILQTLETQSWRMLKYKSISFWEIICGLLGHKMLVRFLPWATASLLRDSSLSLRGPLKCSKSLCPAGTSKDCEGSLLWTNLAASRNNHISVINLEGQHYFPAIHLEKVLRTSKKCASNVYICTLQLSKERFEHRITKHL